MSSSDPTPGPPTGCGPIRHGEPRFPKDAFAGTAAYYARYRVPYPNVLLADLLDRARVAGKGRLLDLACGPGRIALAFASSFREIWAVDLEAEMIEEGRREAARRGLANLRWEVAMAEAIEAPAASFELLAIGEAFHRLDQPRVAAQALRWLRPGGALATLGCHGILSGTEPWQELVVQSVRKWTGRPAGAAGPSEPGSPDGGPEQAERVMREAGFVAVGSHPFVQTQAWTTEAILGYLYSTSVCSKRVLGKNADPFEAELRAALLAHDPRGVFREDMRWGYTFGRKAE